MSRKASMIEHRLTFLMAPFHWPKCCDAELSLSAGGGGVTFQAIHTPPVGWLNLDSVVYNIDEHLRRP